MLLISTTSYAQEGPQWKAKPIQCAKSESALQLIEESGEKALVGGIASVRVNDTMQQHPVYLFINADTGTFTFIEYHLTINEICIISYGGGIDFDVQKYFEKKVSS